MEQMEQSIRALDWHLAEETQLKAVEWLVTNIPREQLSLLFWPHTEKSCWQNAVQVVTRIGYPENEAALPHLVELFQDLNWPGAQEAELYLRTLERAVVMPYLEAGGRRAVAENDWDWLWFLFDVCERMGVGRADFQDGAVFDAMKLQHDLDE